MYFPILLDVTGKLCVVVGGGRIGERKALAFLQYGARVRVVSPEVTSRIEAMAAEGKVEWLKRSYREGDLEGAVLAVTACDDFQENTRVRTEGDRLRVPVNAVDDPVNCSFIVPAIVQRGDLTLAVSTQGNSPALSGRVRKLLEQEFGDEWADWIEILGELRQLMHEVVPDPEVRQAFFMDLVYRDEPLRDLRAGRVDEVRTSLRGEVLALAAAPR